MAMLFVAVEVEDPEDQEVIDYLEDFKPKPCRAHKNLYILLTDQSPSELLSELLKRFHSESPNVVVSELKSPVASSNSPCFFWLCDRREHT